MRKLLCIPIVHAESDLGSLGPAMSERSAALLGDKRWAQHNQVVAGFWQSVADYLSSTDKANLKIYQDGLAADGELGLWVIEEAARRGSRNHRIILDLVERGAEIRKTEDVSLLLEEYQGLVKLGESASAGGTLPDPAAYLEGRHRLEAARDSYIADRINTTLEEGEIGVLLMGAHHDVTPLLAKDIAVEWVKDRAAIQEYFRQLVSGRDEKRYQRLATYVASAVEGTAGSVEPQV